MAYAKSIAARLKAWEWDFRITARSFEKISNFKVRNWVICKACLMHLFSFFMHLKTLKYNVEQVKIQNKKIVGIEK